MTGATPHATTATRGTAVTIPLRGAAASRAGGHPWCHVLQKNLALFQLTPDRCDPTSLGAPMPANNGTESRPPVAVPTLSRAEHRSEWGQCFAVGYPPCDLRAKRAGGSVDGISGRLRS